MTFTTQRDAIRKIKQFFHESFCVVLEFGNDNRERNDVMSLNSKIDGLRSVVTSFAYLASVIITIKYCGTPLFVLNGFTQTIREWANATLPVPVFGFALCSLSDSISMLVSFSVMAEIYKLRNWSVKMLMGDVYESTATTLTDMFALVFGDKFSFLTTLGMVPSIFTANQFPSLSKSSSIVSFRCLKHVGQYWHFNGSSQVKSGELLETQPAYAEGNQQPSAMNSVRVIAKVQRLSGEELTNKPLLAPGPIALGMI